MVDTAKPVRDFLSSLTPAYLVQAGVLQQDSRFGYLLKGASVAPLLQLMRREGVYRLVHRDAWELHIDGRFRNTWAGHHVLEDYTRLVKPGDVFKDTNQFINPFYESAERVAPAATVPLHAQFDEPIFTSEDIAKPENRCNLAIFHLLMLEPFYEWFVTRLGLPVGCYFYPRENLSGARPDYVIHDAEGKHIGVVEIELGMPDQEQVQRYESKYGRTLVITGTPAPGAHLSLAEIAGFLESLLPTMAHVQQRLSAKYLIKLIADSVNPGSSSKRAPVSEKMLGHPFVSRLVSLLEPVAPRPGSRGPAPGMLYWDTVKAEGFSLKAYSLEGVDKRISLLAISGGRDGLIFQSKVKYMRYLGHKPKEAAAWCRFVSETLHVPIEFLGPDQRREVPTSIVMPHVEELARHVAALA